MSRTFYALLVGIDRYRSPVPQLNGCVNDIEAVAALFKELSVDGEYSLDLRTLKDSEATRAAVIGGFREHLCRAGPEDVALLYYSGHGSQEDAPPELWHLEPDRLNETLVCYDSRDEGNWDLADKELGALIAGVAERGTHTVIVLDCCHSGSGTRASLEDGIAVRRAPTDRRRRTIDTYLDGALTTRSRGSEEANAGWVVMPSGKHLLLAACHASETAKEVVEQSKPHGAFTAALLATLRQTRGSITYRDLLKRAEAQVRLRVAHQVPQAEASDPVDLQRPFLGGAVRRERANFTLRYDRQLGWVIDGGAVHCIPQVRGETTVLAIFGLEAGFDQLGKLDAALATAEVEEVRPELSRVKLSVPDDALEQTGSYRAVVIATPIPAMAVTLMGGQNAVLVRNALATGGSNGKASLLVREAGVDEQARLRVEATPHGFNIFRAGADRPLVAEVTGTGPHDAEFVVQRLEHIARWEAVAALENPGSRLAAQPVEIAIFRPVDQGGKEAWQEADPRRGISLEYRYVSGKWVQPRLRIELRNRGPEDIYCALLRLGEDYSVSSALIPGGTLLIPAGKSAAANDGKDIYGFVSEARWREGRTEVRDLLKLIVSTEQFDATLFDQEKSHEASSRPPEVPSNGSRPECKFAAWRQVQSPGTASPIGRQHNSRLLW
jgi:hypothetical protein